MEVERLKILFPGRILDCPYPKPYPSENPDTRKIKAIVLGCDPSNLSHDGETRVLETVFGIQGRGKDGRYFAGILHNLAQLDLGLTDLYVQNLCRNYFDTVTENNDCFQEAAKLWRDSLWKELDALKIPFHIPVFLTSQHIYKALVSEELRTYSPVELYADLSLTPIKSEDNYLSRPLFPLYRGGKGTYKLENQPLYKEHVMKYLLQNFKKATP